MEGKGRVGRNSCRGRGRLRQVVLSRWIRAFALSIFCYIRLTLERRLSSNSFKSTLLDRLLVSHADQVDALLAEFRDHNVVRGSFVAPTRISEEDEDEADGEGEWVWIPLAREALKDVVKDMEE